MPIERGKAGDSGKEKMKEPPRRELELTTTDQHNYQIGQLEPQMPRYANRNETQKLPNREMATAESGNILRGQAKPQKIAVRGDRSGGS